MPPATTTQDCLVRIRPKLRNGVFSADGVPKWENTVIWSIYGFVRLIKKCARLPVVFMRMKPQDCKQSERLEITQ